MTFDFLSPCLNVLKMDNKMVKNESFIKHVDKQELIVRIKYIIIMNEFGIYQ